MISVRRTTKLYNRLSTIKDQYKNKENCYICEDSHITKTIDLEEGTIPFTINCQHEGCNKVAKSTFYQLPEEFKNISVSLEWYRPSLKETLKLRGKNEVLLDHVLRGGLILRERKLDDLGL